MKKLTRKDFLKVSGVGLGAVSLALLTGCGSSSDSTTSSSEDTETTSSSTEESQASESTETVEDTFTYPMDAVTLTINYTSSGSDLYDASTYPSWAEDIYDQKNIRDATGVTLEDTGSSPASQAMSEEFLLMLVSGEWPDIIYCDWLAFSGGPAAALSEGYIVDLNEYAEYMPNLQNYLDENPDIRAMIETDDGQLYSVPYIRDEGQQVQTGLVIRQDWLDEVGMDAPTTVSEMYDVLTAFKEQLGVTAPLTFESRWLFLETASGSLSSPYETVYPFYVVDGTIKFGPLEDNYKEFVTEMAKWYAEGLLDVDFASVDKSTVQAKFANGESGVAIQQINNVENCISANLEDASYAVTSLQSLVMNEGDTPLMSQFANSYDGSFGFSVSTTCSNTEAACRYLDYFYGEEGTMLLNYGLEGVTYELVDGEVQFTDLIMNNEETTSPTSARGYVCRYKNWPHIQENSVIEKDETSQSTLATWTAQMENYAVPALAFTEDESEVISDIYSDIDDYCREKILSFILGTDSMDNWDSFIDTITGMGIDDVVECYQAAYDRYISR